MSWQPSTEAYQAGLANRGEYVGGSAFAEGDTLQLQPLPAAVELAKWIAEHFSVSGPVGLRRGALVQHPLRDASGRLRRRDVHEEGRALDVPVNRKTVGNAVADWAVLHSRELGIQRVIWDHVRWRSSSTADSWANYTGPNAHTDHVHIEVLPLGWSRAQMLLALQSLGAGVAGSSDLLVTSRVSSGELPAAVLLPVAVLGALAWWASR